jgi:hypothetical protein
MSSNFLHVTEFHFFLRLNNVPLYVHIYHFVYLCICWWMLRLLQLLAIMNIAANNMIYRYSYEESTFSSFRYVSRSRIAGSHGNYVLNFLK